MRNAQGYIAWLTYGNPGGGNPNAAYNSFDNNAVTALNVNVPTEVLYKLEIFTPTLNPRLVQSVYIQRGTTEYTVRSGASLRLQASRRG
ncbi:hypothetical protein M3223_13240 [Paenibacillus pasadenensis]|uniref:hypothetical protein n=1 Tax=Paenibacillus pasadenensis TaxID=217090 RepID=UPI0020421D4D|nr:hypothetical protein [Paenibacillus pasadenensis]MCM3748315.1 hypothetical protein [Paenibacillus pasadenensis]